MIARRKTTFLRFCGLLRDIEADKSNLAAVKELNIGLVRQILGDEKCVKHYRSHGKELRRRLRNDRPSREGAALLRKQIATCDRIVGKYLDQLYIWRCIGDGLAYAYIDTFNMRQVLFETADYSVKPEAGFISGKDGFADELWWLIEAIKHGVPAVLSDITNSVRYGDVCLLGGPDPYPFEVKSHPSRRNQRGKRQAAKLAELQKFLEEDVAVDFRGSPYVRREATEMDSNCCIEQMNQCIQSARPGGYSICCPEPGLIYAAIDGDIDLSLIFDNKDMEQSSLFILNIEKSEKRWVPYLPFVNGIRDTNVLFDFILGNMSLLVLVDAAYLCKQLAMPGWKVSMIEHPTMIILFEHESGGTFASSKQFYGRFGFEFMSLRWFVEHQKSTLPKSLSDMQELKSGAIIEMEQLEALDQMIKNAPGYFNK